MRFSKRIWEPTFPFDPARAPVFYGWIILAAATMGFLASIPGQTIGISVYTDKYIEVLGLNRIQLTTAYLIGTALSGFVVARGGALFDAMGARRFIVMASLLFGLALFYMSLMDKFIAVLGLGGVTAFAMAVSSLGFLGIRFFGQGMVTLGSRSMLAKWWNLRRGRMVAINGIFVAVGFSMAPRILDWEIQLLGWRESLVLNACLLTFGMSLLGWLLFRDNPEEAGLRMDNGWRPRNRLENPDTYLGKEFTRAEAVRTYSFWIITLCLAFHGLFATAYTFHVLDLARSFAVSREEILNYFIYSSVLSIIGNFCAGWVTDRTRLRYVISFFAFCGMAFAIGLLLLPHPVGKVLLIGGMGFSWGTFPILSSVGYARYFGRAHIGAINGSSLSWMVWGSAAGPLAFSIGKDYLGGYESVIMASVLAYLVLAVGGFFAQNPSRQAQA